MTDMIERMARAICVSVGGSPDMEFAEKPFWKQYETPARAALSALQEPTDAMVEAGANLPGAFQGTSARYAKVRETWFAMIKAAKGGEC